MSVLNHSDEQIFIPDIDVTYLDALGTCDHMPVIQLFQVGSTRKVTRMRKGQRCVPFNMKLDDGMIA